MIPTSGCTILSKRLPNSANTTVKSLFCGKTFLMKGGGTVYYLAKLNFVHGFTKV